MPEELEAPGSPLVARDRCLRLQVKLSSSLYRVQAAHLQKEGFKGESQEFLCYQLKLEDMLKSECKFLAYYLL